MGFDNTKTFTKKNAHLVPSDEQVLGAIMAEPKGGAWRRGMRAAGAVTSIAAEVKEARQTDTSAGDAAALPDARMFWVVITNKQVHFFEGMAGSAKAGPAGAHFPHDRIADMTFNKKLMISKLNVAFKDGSAVELDVAKQKLQSFLDAIASRDSYS